MAASLGGRGFQQDEYERVGLRHPDISDRTPNSVAFDPQSTEPDRARPADSISLHSTTPLAPRVHANTMPPLPSGFPGSHSSSNLLESQQNYPYSGLPPTTPATRPSNGRSSSWDLLNGIKKFEQEYSEFDSRNASQAHLRFADGDLPKNKAAKLYNFLLNVSIITRWFLFIVPVLAILWIPGILGVTAFKDGKIWNVKLIRWSIWLTVVWAGWWGALATAKTFPHIARHTIGVISAYARRYIVWLSALQRYIALSGWTFAIWVSFNPLIGDKNIGEKKPQVSFLAKLLFAFVICAGILLFEKFAIQWIASKFHERSYADRIAEQKRAVKILVTLYSNSIDIPGRLDTMVDSVDLKPKQADPKRFFKRALKGVRSAATTTTTALGNVASEIAGTSVLQPDSPQGKVQMALQSANKSRLLARRLFYSFRRSGQDTLVKDDIARFFPSPEQAETAFTLFDKDDNGDATREEVEMACLECHREQLSIEHSMQDLDSAVGRLDNILMSLYIVVAMLVIAVALEAQLNTIIAGAGTFVLGLSWLIGASCQEVLSSIIFLFIKHPFDVGDRVDIEKVGYVVKEIRLLSTIFIDLSGCLVQVPNLVLNGKFIHNIRRSPQMSEKFEFEVAYSTSFEQIEQLRAKMLAFVKAERRDFLPSFDVVVADFPGQEKLVLYADIKYKSNWQQGAVKVKRRNKWICALKTSLAELKIYGPGGNPDAEAGPAMYTKVPWDEVQAKKAEKELKMPEPLPSLLEPRLPRADYSLLDKNAVLQNDEARMYGETEQLYMTNPRSAVDSPAPSRVNTPAPQAGPAPAPVIPLPPIPIPARLPRPTAEEVFEMTPTTPRIGPSNV